MLKRLSQARGGDTIVEVLVAMAVIGLILAASFATSTRAMQVGRRAQERIEALKLVESQIEQLKFMAADPANVTDPDTNIFDTSPVARKTFCLVAHTKVIIPDFADHTTYPAGCVHQGLYGVGVKYDETQNNLFTVQAKWNRLGGGAAETVVIQYRLHP